MEKKKRKEPGLKEWALILAAGALLLFLSLPEFLKKEEKLPSAAGVTQEPAEEKRMEYEAEMAKRLEEFLTGLDGVSTARVILTVKTTSERMVLYDSDTQKEETAEDDGEGGTRIIKKYAEEKKTVITGEKEPYLVYERMPQAEGVAIILSGTGKEKLLEISEAVQALFDLPAHKVKVIWN